MLHLIRTFPNATTGVSLQVCHPMHIYIYSRDSVTPLGLLHAGLLDEDMVSLDVWEWVESNVELMENVRDRALVNEKDSVRNRNEKLNGGRKIRQFKGWG